MDDRPYGGGAGTILAAEPCALAIEYAQSQSELPIAWYAPDPRGEVITQSYFASLSKNSGTIGIICGHYEGIDERIFKHFNISKISLGAYIITGGELAAGVIIDGVVRLLPGLLDPESLQEESHGSGLNGLLEYPHYTRPEVWRESIVPSDLISGNHAAIIAWRKAHITSP